MAKFADDVFGEGYDFSGIYFYSSQGILSGVDFCGYGGDAPKKLPQQDSLRHFNSTC